MADGNEQQQQQLVMLNDIQGDKQITGNQYISVNNRDINQINDKKELLELEQLKSTRKLYVEGDNISEFAQFLAKATKTQITGVQLVYVNHQQQHPSSQQAQQQAALAINNHDDNNTTTNKGVIRFKNPVPTEKIKKALQNSSLQLHVMVSKSSSNDDSSFFSSSQKSSSSSFSLDQQHQQQQHTHKNENLLFYNSTQNLRNENNNTFYQQQQNDDRKLFNKLASLLIENPSWGLKGLVNYVKTTIEIDDRDRFFGVMSERLNDLENAVKLGKIAQEKEEVLITNEINQVNSQKEYDESCFQQQNDLAQQQFSFFYQGQEYLQGGGEEEMTGNEVVSSSSNKSQNGKKPKSPRPHISEQDHYYRMEKGRNIQIGGSKSRSRSRSVTPPHNATAPKTQTFGQY